MATIKVSGKGVNNWFAEQLVKDLGAEEARNRTCGPMLEAVEQAIKSGTGFVMVSFDESKQDVIMQTLEIGDVIAKDLTA